MASCWKVRKKLEEGKPVDWAPAEALAFGYLLLEGKKETRGRKPLDWASVEALAFGSLLLEGKKETRRREAIGLDFSRGLGI